MPDDVVGSVSDSGALVDVILRSLRRKLGDDKLLSGLIDRYFADPEGFEANRDLGLAMIEHSQLVVPAEPCLVKALGRTAAGADRRRLLAALGQVYQFRAHYDGAIGVYAELARHEPACLASLGEVLHAAGRIDEASAAHERLIAVAYEGARREADRRGGPIVQFLHPAEVICRRYGEMAQKIDLYVKARRLGLTPKVKVIVTTPSYALVNASLIEAWRDQVPTDLTVLTEIDDIKNAFRMYGSFALFADCYRVPDGRFLRRDLAQHVIQRQWEDAGHPPLLTLDAGHRRRGRDVLAKLGVPADAWFACLHVREPTWHHEEVPWHANGLRCARVETYAKAIEAVTARGGYVIRLGDPSTMPLPPMKNVIDYAHLGDDIRRDWMDVFVAAACRFLIGVVSGPVCVAATFGVPVVGTNWFPLGYWPVSRNDLFIHKLVRRKADGRFLSIEECVAPPIPGTVYPGFYEARGLEVIDNSPDDIAAVVTEMMDRLDGRPADENDGERRRRRFRTMSRLGGIDMNARTGREFLRRHPFLIGE